MQHLINLSNIPTAEIVREIETRPDNPYKKAKDELEKLVEELQKIDNTRGKYGQN